MWFMCVKKGIKQTFHGRFLAWGRHGTRIGLRNWGLTVRSTVANLHKFKLGIVFFHVFIMFIYICVCVFVRVFIIIQLSSQDMLWVSSMISWPPWNDWDPKSVGGTSPRLSSAWSNHEQSCSVRADFACYTCPFRWKRGEKSPSPIEMTRSWIPIGLLSPWTQLIQVLLFILFSRRDGAWVSRLGHPRNMLCPMEWWWSQHKSWCWQEDWRSGIACSSGKRDGRGSANPWDDWTCSRLHGRQSTAGRSPKNGHQHWTWDDTHQILGPTPVHCNHGPSPKPFRNQIEHKT